MKEYTFYENVYHLLRKPKGAYTPGEDPIDINNTNFKINYYS